MGVDVKKSFLPVMLLLSLAACSQPPVPGDHFYRLRLAPPERPLANPRFKGTMEIDRFVADGLTTKLSIVYSTGDRPLEVKAYHYHLWTDPPVIMLRDQLVGYLRAAKVASKVVTPEMRVGADYVVTGKINRLEKVIGSPAKVAVELELSLGQRTDGKLLFLDTYRVVTASENDTVGAAVKAINKALGKVYASFAADISKI